MALNFEDYLIREYAKASADTDFTFTLIPETSGTRTAFTILNAGAADVKTYWEVYGNTLLEKEVYDASYASSKVLEKKTFIQSTHGEFKRIYPYS